MTETQLYHLTRKAWVLGKQREGVKYAASVYKGITREVYKIENWFHIEIDGKTKWGFNGLPVGSDIRNELNNKSVEKYFSKGTANPIRYVNC